MAAKRRDSASWSEARMLTPNRAASRSAWNIDAACSRGAGEVFGRGGTPAGGAEGSLDQALAAELRTPRSIVFGECIVGVTRRTGAKRLQGEGWEHLPAAQRGVDSLAGEGIEEVGGISHERRAWPPAAARVRSKGSRDEHGRDAPSSSHARRELGPITQPPLEERGAVGAP